MVLHFNEFKTTHIQMTNKYRPQKQKKTTKNETMREFIGKRFEDTRPVREWIQEEDLLLCNSNFAYGIVWTVKISLCQWHFII